MVDFDWRIESQRSIICGSGESKRRQEFAAQKLIGSIVLAAQTVGRIPELQIAFSNKNWLLTFCMYQGQPGWSVLFNEPSLGALGVKGGRVNAEASPPNN